MYSYYLGHESGKENAKRVLGHEIAFSNKQFEDIVCNAAKKVIQEDEIWGMVVKETTFTIRFSDVFNQVVEILLEEQGFQEDEYQGYFDGPDFVVHPVKDEKS